MSPHTIATDRKWDIQILGPLRVLEGNQELPVATRRQRALLVLLALEPNQVQPVDRLIDRLWDGNPPEGAPVTLRSYISHLRQHLGGIDGFGGRLLTRGSGYVLELPACTVDARRFRVLVESGHANMRDGDPRSAISDFDAALGLWRGQPLAEIADHSISIPVLAELSELRMSAVESRLRALIETGRHREALPTLESLAVEEPLREGPRMLLMLALYRDGRAPAALNAHRAYRDLLADQLGIDPSLQMAQLHQRILAQDATLDIPAAVPQQSETIELASTLIKSLRDISQIAAAAADELLTALNTGEQPRPHLEPVHSALGA